MFGWTSGNSLGMGGCAGLLVEPMLQDRLDVP